jgi:succinoglycan biosynthesis transport protein ExoP
MRVGLQSGKRVVASQVADGELDLRAFGSALRRNKWKIIRPTLLTGLVALGAVQLITPKYLSEARVFIEGRENVFLRPEAEKQNFDRAVVDQEAVTSQVQLILSRDLARDVINQLKLGERVEFDPALHGVSPVKVVLGLLGLVKNPLHMTPEERVLDAYYDRLSVFPVEKSRVIAVDFQSEDPELAARVANAIADNYLVLQQTTKREQARSAGQWLSGEIDNMRKKVADAEGKVEAFRATSNLLVGTNNTTLSAQQLGDVNAQLVTMRAQKSDAEAKARLIRDMLRSGKPIDSTDILNSELIRRLSEQRVTLRAQLAEQSATLLGNHPRIKELKAQISDLDQQIRAEAETVVRSLENDAKIAGARLDSQTSNLDQLKHQAASTNEQDVQLRALERDAKSQRDLLESYLAKFREATSRDTINSAPADARVISRATVSNIAAYPKKLATVLVATLAMMVLSAGMVLSRELLSGSVYVPAARVAQPRAVQPLPLTEPAAAHVAPPRREMPPALGVPISAIEDVAHSFRDGGSGGRCVAVFGATNGVETSLAAITLARSLAKNARVVLVDLGAGNAEIRAISSDPTAPGLSDLVLGAASFGNIITKDKLSPLHLISAGQPVADEAAVLSSRGLESTFAALARSYEHVIVDAGAVAGVPVDRVAQFAPRALLVADALTSPGTMAARERLLMAGYADVTVLLGARARETSRAA